MTGSDVDLWGELDVNPNMVALDGFIGGVQQVAVTNAPVTLTAPAGFTATPTPGPTQSQNRVLRFTGAMTGNVRITLPLPGSYLIDNRTTGAFVLSFQGVTATEVVAIEQGEIVEIYNDGANVRFVNLGRVGAMEFWGGVSAMPAWVAACTVKPFLYADGAVYNLSDFPYLGAKYVGRFGGNGVTTFGVQDLRGRYPLAYDGTGTRVTVAGCGINGQTLGATLDAQTVALLATQIPAITSANASQAISVTSTNYLLGNTTTNSGSSPGGGTQLTAADPGSGAIISKQVSSGNNYIAVTSNNTGGQGHNNMPNTQVAGIWVIKT